MNNNHNTHFYSLEEVKRTLEATKEFEDGEQIYYFIGALRYLYDEFNKQQRVLDKIKDYINNYDVFKEFTFPLMKRDEEQQVLTSIKYEFDTSIKKNLKKYVSHIHKKSIFKIIHFYKNYILKNM